MNEGPANGNDVAAADEHRCPECDASDSWRVIRRHRFSPFGAVLLAVLAFWSAVAGWLLGFGYLLSGVLTAGAAVVGIATRKAEICGACGLVRPSRHY